MNIQSEKLELVRLILETENPGILSTIKKILYSETKKDFWDKLTDAQKNEIQEGMREIEIGEVVDYEDVVKKHR